MFSLARLLAWRSSRLPASTTAEGPGLRCYACLRAFGLATVARKAVCSALRRPGADWL